MNKLTNDPVETRYFRSDTQTVNGLTASKLGTTQSASSLSATIGRGRTALSAYAGIRAWRRLSDGTEIEITSGTPVAVVSTSSTGIVSATWSCPQTSLTTTDAVVVRVYGKWGSSGTWNLLAVFITEQLGAGQLDAATWTVYYYISYTRYVDPDTGIVTYTAAWGFGTSTFNSRIENFQWTPPVTKTWHDIASWSLTLLTRKWNPISTYDLSLNTAMWNNIALWNFQLITSGWHTITSWIINVQSRAWLNIASWILNMQTRLWQTVTSWTQNIITRIWHAIATWTMELATGILKIWRDIASWTATILTKTWHTIASWIFNAVTLGWHTVTSWAATFEFHRFPFIILIGAITITAATIIILWKKR